MFSIVFNLLLWLVAAWLLYPLVFIQLNLADIQTSFLRSTAGVVLLIIMFGKNMIDIMFQKMTKSELHLRATAMNIVLTYIFIIVSVVSFAISVLLMIATRQQNNVPPSPMQ